MKFQNRRSRGSAILMVMWGMMIMGMAVMGLVRYLRFHVVEAMEESKAFEARLLAVSGLALAQHPAVKPSDPLLKQEISTLKRYEVKVTTESARIAINQIVARAETMDYCKRLFVLWGLDPEKAAIAAESIRDWVDGDDRAQPLGAEEIFYTMRGEAGYPRNAPFAHLDEMLLVRGMDEVAQRRPDWKESFTLFGDGLIDVNEASAEILEVVCEVPPAQVAEVILKRQGPDLLSPTIDDTPYKAVSELQAVLGLDRREFVRVSERLTVAQPFKRIVSVGIVGDFEKKLTLITGPGVHLLEESHKVPKIDEEAFED